MRLRVNYLFLLFILIPTISLAGKQYNKNERYFNVNGVNLYCMTIGHGSPIIVLHGGPGLDHTYLLPQLKELAKNHKLIFYDQRGSGKSSGAIDSESININNFVSDLEGLRKALEIKKMNLLGHSWGGLLAMYYAINYPEHVKSLMLLNSVGYSSEFFSPFNQNVVRRRTPEDSIGIAKIMTSDEFKNADIGTMNIFFKIFFKSYFYNQSLDSELTIDFNKRTAENIFPIYNLFGKLLANFDIKEKLKILNCPVLIVHGDYDPIPLKCAEELNADIKNSKLVVLKNCGHFSYIEAPRRLFKVCNEFLAQNKLERRIKKLGKNHVG